MGLSDVGSSEFLNGEMPTTLSDQVRTLLDAMTLSCGRTYMGLIPIVDLDSPVNLAKFSAECRATKVTKDYYKAARKLDQARNQEPQAPSRKDSTSAASPTNVRSPGLVRGAFGGSQRTATASPTPSPE